MKKIGSFIIFFLFSLTFVLSQIKVNLNTATVDELKQLPGIGKTKAKRIIEYRDKVGGFKNIKEILNVKGIGPKLFEKIRPYITVGTASLKTSKPKSSFKSKPYKKTKSNSETYKTIVIEKLPDDVFELKCWNCKRKFWIKKGFSKGWCPYCGVKWKINTKNQ